ncbi:hypothetical protein P6166_06760 [Stenotrophomonas sp. HITSZ_GD]|uniref:hypothetical protein n=1 Tax=Stenotrophomonas sp. HITSZ_GD TaxID=3037248 RepID=UPI00240DF899|nr:hypothetical protein [Stenotrophomonas sp. HITSZ_GD]MDG2525053.1 hypothetical protein [Stenotrophomonas sp. HITSZ_GD]
MKRTLLAAVCLGMAWTAQAAPACEDNFKAIGDPRNGQAFLSTVTVAGLTPRSALGQVRRFAKDEGFETGGELYDAKGNGEFFYVQNGLRLPLVFMANAENGGNVAITVKLARGQVVKEEDARKGLCDILGKLKAGKEGEAIAAAAREADGVDRYEDVDATQLSDKLEKEAKKTASAGAGTLSFKDLMLGGTSSRESSEQVAQALLPFYARYIGKKFRVDGQLYTVSHNPYSGTDDVAYLVTKSRGLFKVRDGADMNLGRFQIKCTMAPDQKAFFTTLKGQDYAKLEGTVANVTGAGIEMKDCRQAR